MGASWNRFHTPVAIAAIDAERKGHQSILFRQMLKDFEPPAWVREVVVVADAGYPANATLKLIEELEWTYVFAMPRASSPMANTCVIWCNPGSRGSGRVRGFFDQGAQAYIVTVTSVMMHPLGKLAEGMSHGGCDSSDQSRGSLAFGAGGGPQAQRGCAHRYLLSSAPSSCPLVWPWRGGPAPGDSRRPSCPL